MASITGLRTNSSSSSNSSSSRVVVYPMNCLQHSLRIVTIQSQGSGKIEWLYKEKPGCGGCLGFPVRPSIAAKVPTASIWDADWRSSPLSLFSQSAWEDSTSPGGQPSAKDYGQTGGTASPLPEGGNSSAAVPGHHLLLASMWTTSWFGFLFCLCCQPMPLLLRESAAINSISST